MKRIFFEKMPFFPPAAGLIPRPTTTLSEIRTEAVRKSIHFLIALSPGMAVISYPLTVLALTAGVSIYAFTETLRLSGVKVPLVTVLTDMASRPRDLGRFVLGPVTLGIGVLLALLLFPSPVAFIGIYALAFGDGFASLVGKLFGRYRPAFLFGKSVEGTFACFIATYLCAYFVSRNFTVSLIAGFTAAAVEALPLEDYDNIALPLVVGTVVQLAMM